MPILYTLYFILFTFLAWRRLNWAVLLIIFALPSYLIRFSIGPVPMTLLEIMVLIVFVIWAIKNNFKFVILNFKSFWLILFFLLTATLSVFVSPDTRAALGIWKSYFLEPILFFIVLKDLLAKTNEQKVNTENFPPKADPPRAEKLKIKNLTAVQIISVLSLSALLLSLFAIYQKFTGFWIPDPWAAAAGRRVTSLFEYPNALGLFLGPLMPLFIGQILSIKKLLVISYWLLVIFVSLLAIFWAHSTGALVGIAAGLIFMGIVLSFSSCRKRSCVLYSVFTVFTLIVLGSFLFKMLPNNFKNELLLKDWSGQVREQMWKETWMMLKTRPILGAGLAGYQTVVAPFHQDKNIEIFLYPHNWIFNFWSETGLLGLLAFLALIINFFYLGFKKLLTTNYSLLTISVMSSMVVILVHGLVDAPYFKNDLAILFWLIFALVV